MINHRGGILIFGQIFDFGENRKFEILNPSSNSNFEFELAFTINQNRMIPITKHTFQNIY